MMDGVPSSRPATAHIVDGGWNHATMHLGAATLLVILAIAQTWPLAAHLRTALPGSGAGDNLTFVWTLWWMRHEGANPLRFLHSQYVLFPFGGNLILHTHTIVNAFVAATLLKGVGLVEAQNLLVLTSVALNGIAAYALAYDITHHRSASLLAAIVFGGSPYFAAHLEGHFNLIAGWVIPVWLLLAKRSAASGGTRDAVIAGVALALVAYTDYYYLVFALAAAACLWSVTRFHPSIEFHPRHPRTSVQIFVWLVAGVLASVIGLISVTGGTSLQIGPAAISLRDTFNPRLMLWMTLAIAALLRWRTALRWEHLSPKVMRADARVALLVAGTFLVTASPLIVPGARLAAGSDYVSPPRYFRSAPPGIDLVALMQGNPRHPIVGRYVQSMTMPLHIDQIEGIAWLGLVPAAMAWLGSRRWRCGAQRRAWAWTFAIFLVWALGPFLRVGGWATALVLPETVLRYLPIVSNARIPGRAMVVAYLALAMLSAMGFASMSPRSRWFGWTLIMLTIVDFASAPIALYRVEIPLVYDVLRTRVDEGALLELPMGMRDGLGSLGSPDPGSAMYQTIHQHPVVGGFLARIPDRIATGYLEDPVFGPLLRASEPGAHDVVLPAPGDLRDGLRQRGVRYVILRRPDAAAPMMALVQDALGSSLLARDATRDLYEVRAE